MLKDNQQDSSRFIPVGIVRTPEQIDIQTATCKVLLVEANAGAAKTTTLALRIGEAIAANVTPESILVLVFTDTAREVMRKRLTEIGVHYTLVNRMEIHTFEEFSKKQLGLIEDKGVKSYPNARQQFAPMMAAIDGVYNRYGNSVENLTLNTNALAIAQYLDAQPCAAQWDRVLRLQPQASQHVVQGGTRGWRRFQGVGQRIGGQVRPELKHLRRTLP